MSRDKVEVWCRTRRRHHQWSCAVGQSTATAIRS